MPLSTYIRNIRAKIGTDLLLLVGAAAVVVNDRGEVLLHRRSDNGLWWLPGGSIEPGENPADAVVREVWEETGVHVIPERLVGVFSGPEYYSQYPNGDESMYVSLTFACRPIGGEPLVNDDESLDVRYFAVDALPPLDPRNAIRIALTLRNNPRAYFRTEKEGFITMPNQRRIVTAESAPRPVGPYSQAVIANEFVYCSGQIALDPATGELVGDDAAAQTAQVLKNLSAVLNAAGSSPGHVVKTTVFLRSMQDFTAMNQVYAEFFPNNPPARSTVGDVDLPRGALVEIEAVAVLA